MKAPELRKIIPARKPCVADVLCNWEMNIPKEKICVVILGPIVMCPDPTQINAPCGSKKQDKCQEQVCLEQCSGPRSTQLQTIPKDNSAKAWASRTKRLGKSHEGRSSEL